MTAQDELDLVTSPAAAQEEEDRRSRSSFRPPFTQLTCDIGDLVGPYDSSGQYSNRVVALQLRNIRNVQAQTPFSGSEFDLEVKVPAKANIHSEAVLMVTSAAEHDSTITSIRHLANRKGVTLKEEVHHFKGRKQEPQDSGNWVDADLTTRYYSVMALGASTNGNKAPVVEVTPEALAEAAQAVQGLSHAEALTAVGADLVSKLVLNGAKGVRPGVKNTEGVYLSI